VLATDELPEGTGDHGRRRSPTSSPTPTWSDPSPTAGVVRALGLVGPEGGHQILDALFRHVVGVQRAGEALGLAHLLDVEDATVAEPQMVLERATFSGGQDSFEIVGHQFDELDARNVARRAAQGERQAVIASAARWRSSAAPDLRARAVTEHALVAVGDPEQLADLVGVPAIDVPQPDHGALRGRQQLDGFSDLSQRLQSDRV
jgi:hypothetical protein